MNRRPIRTKLVIRPERTGTIYELSGTVKDTRERRAKLPELRRLAGMRVELFKRAG